MVSRVALFFVVLVVAGSQAVTLEEALRQMDTLVGKVNYAAHDATNQIQLTGSIIQKLSTSVVTNGTKQVQMESRRLINELDTIVQDARKEGFNIDSCLQGERSLLNELSELSELELAACTNRFASQGETSLGKALDGIGTIIKEVYNASAELEKCKSTDTDCINKAVKLIEFYDIDIPRQIQEELDIGQNKAEANRLYLGECGIKAADNLVSHGGTIVYTFERCVDKIVHPP